MAPSTKPAPAPSTVTATEYVIEISDERNRSILFGPTQGKIRGAFAFHKMGGGGTTSGLQEMPDLPGMLIHVNPATGVAKITDPLNKRDFKQTLQRAKEVHKHTFMVECEPVEDREYELDQDGIATWLYWMRRYVDNEQAISRGPDLPGHVEIAKLGKARRNFYDLTAYAKEAVAET